MICYKKIHLKKGLPYSKQSQSKKTEAMEMPTILLKQKLSLNVIGGWAH